MVSVQLNKAEEMKYERKRRRKERGREEGNEKRCKTGTKR